MSTVAITQNDDIEKSIPAALEHLKLKEIIENKLVAIKPNETWASEADTTAVTQPDTLQAVIQFIKQFNPEHIVVTGGAGAAETNEVLEIVGMMDVVEEEEVEFFDHNRPPFEEIQLEYDPENEITGPQESVMVNPRVLEYDTLIAVNQLKMHETATVTMALKNIAMSYPAADYYGHPRSKQKHSHHFFADMHSFIAVMIKRFPIDLAVTVGHPAMVGTGPIGGRTVETGITIASLDAVAADVVGAKLLGFDAQGVRQLWEAGRMGLGETNTSNMNFPAMSLGEAYQVFTEKVYGKRMTIEHP